MCLWLLLDVEEDEVDEVWVFLMFLGIFLLTLLSSGNGAKTGSGDSCGKGWITTGGMAGGAVMAMSGASLVCFGDEVLIGVSTSIFKRNHSKLNQN